MEKLLKNKIASRILKEFSDDVISKQSLSTAISNFKAQAKDHWLLIAADREIIRALDPSSFF